MRTLNRAFRRDDEGSALLTVVGVAAVLLVIVAICASFTVAGLRKSKQDADWSAALAAAYGGAEEYSNRLSNDPTYSKYGNKLSPFTIASGSVSLITNTTANPAFDVATGGTWASVPGSGGRASFRYEVDNSDVAATGVIRLRVTGKVGDATRSILANIRQHGFVSYLYFSDYELVDPLIAGSCTVKYAWEGTATGCSRYPFLPDDDIAGPVHSNDTIASCGATFQDTVTTADPGNPNWEKANSSGLFGWILSLFGLSCSSSATTTFVKGEPQTVAKITMPTTNSTMKTDARCTYQGPTQITLNAGGTMTVVSPLTTTTGPGGAACGAIADLQKPAGATVNVPSGNLVYVGDYTGTTYPTGFSCQNSNAGWALTVSGVTLKYPATDEVAAAGDVSAAPYGCTRGDLYIKGTMKGTMTAAANWVYVNGSINYANDATDLLGLVGENGIVVRNPVQCNFLLPRLLEPVGLRRRHADRRSHDLAEPHLHGAELRSRR
ncbi:hypothetical protein ACDF64_01425 [Agromyces sp. MMS24-JH15]|uniref:hypothetical protein n=1 Tax=Agromyces sp. MMS24-JH15 TaxID=3243765 RepID=UPI003747EF05